METPTGRAEPHGLRPYQLLLNQTVQVQFPGHAEFQSGIVTNFPDKSFVVRFPQSKRLPKGLTAGQALRSAWQIHPGFAPETPR